MWGVLVFLEMEFFRPGRGGDAADLVRLRLEVLLLFESLHNRFEQGPRPEPGPVQNSSQCAISFVRSSLYELFCLSVHLSDPMGFHDMDWR